MYNFMSNSNEKNLTQLVSSYKGLVEAIAAKYVNSLLEKDDLIQEGMIGLLAAINSYKSDKGASFETYATKCINTSILGALRKLSRLKDIPQSNIVPLENEDSFDSKFALSAEDEFLAKESVSLLSQALYEELSSFENEVLRLSISGCSYAQIAKRLDKNEKAIDNAMQRIRRKLKRFLTIN